MAKKDAMGQEVDSLYLSLGLNAADLEMGFQTAGQTVRQAMSRLNSEANQIRLKADIDVTRLEAAGKHVDALKVKEKALTDELAVQQKKLELLNRAYQANAKTYGKDSSITRGVDTKRLYQTRDIERLKAQLAQVNAELGKTAQASTGAFGKLTSAAQNAQGKITSTVGAISKLNGAITGVVAGVSAGAGIFALTDKAMKAGNDLYKLSTRLHTTTAEASQLSKVFQLSGTDINSIVPFFARIDKQALAAAKSQNDLSKAMAEFGFSLTDSNGNLLSYQKQLEQLAKAYDRAVQSGREAEFVTNVLGARGAQLVPVLQDYATNMEIVSRIKTTGLLNPKEAHELYIEWQAMQMQAGQLTGAIGQALMPVAAELMPEITKGFAEFAQRIKDNQGAIKEFGSAAGSAIGSLASGVNETVILLGKLKSAIDDVGASSQDLDVFKKQNPYAESSMNLAKLGAGGLGALAGWRVGGWKGAMAGAYGGATAAEEVLGGIGKLMIGRDEFEYMKQKQQLEEQDAALAKKLDEQVKQEKEAAERAAKQAAAETAKYGEQAAQIRMGLEDEVTKTTSKKLKEQLQAIKDKVNASIEEGKTEAKAWVDVADDIKKAMKDAAKEAQEANEELEKSIYSLTHSDLQNTLHGFDLSAKAASEKGADPELVEQEAQLKKSKAIEDFEKETAQYLDGIYADSLTQRLNQIEREKKAWIQKGMDEVQATRAAEQQKRQAVNDSVKNMFTSQKKYLDIYRRAMAGQIDNGMGGMLYDYTQNTEARQQNAVKMIQRAMMKEAGVDPWERTNLAEVQGFQRAMKGANDWGLSLMGQSGADLSEVSSAVTESGAQMTAILEQINSGVPEINTNLSQILGAIQQRGNNPPQINVNPVINVDLGGAYVFDNALKKQLTDDITNDVAKGVTSAVQEATNRINTGFAG